MHAGAAPADGRCSRRGDGGGGVEIGDGDAASSARRWCRITSFRVRGDEYAVKQQAPAPRTRGSTVGMPGCPRAMRRTRR